jgi:hypothetical protein
VPDDVITFGPDRRPRRDAGESIEALFHAHYPRMAYTAFSLVGDWDLAEQLAQAYLRSWRRWPWISDPQAALLYPRGEPRMTGQVVRRREPLGWRLLDPWPACRADLAAKSPLRAQLRELPDQLWVRS